MIKKIVIENEKGDQLELTPKEYKKLKDEMLKDENYQLIPTLPRQWWEYPRYDHGIMITSDSTCIKDLSECEKISI